MSARSVRPTQDHTGRRTVGETDRAGGTARHPPPTMGQHERSGFMLQPSGWHSSVRKDAAQPASWRSFPQRVSVRHLASASLLGATTRKPLVFLVNRGAGSPRADTNPSDTTYWPATLSVSTNPAPGRMILRPSQGLCARSPTARVGRLPQSQSMCAGNRP